jgi:hypothetical protein
MKNSRLHVHTDADPTVIDIYRHLSTFIDIYRHICTFVLKKKFNSPRYDSPLRRYMRNVFAGSRPTFPAHNVNAFFLPASAQSLLQFFKCLRRLRRYGLPTQVTPCKFEFHVYATLLVA